MIFAQLPPGSENAIEAATREGWPEVVLVMIIFALLGAFGFILRRVLDDAKSREIRLADRVTSLESEIRSELFGQLKAGTEAMSKMMAATERMNQAAERVAIALNLFETMFRARPCLLSLVHDGEALVQIEKVIRSHQTPEPRT